MTGIEVRITRLPHGKDLPLPAYHSALAAGLDLLAALADDAPLTIAPGARALVPTGIAIALPAGFEAQVRPRSGLAVRHGITVLNTSWHHRCRLPRRGPGAAGESRQLIRLT